MGNMQKFRTQTLTWQKLEFVSNIRMWFAIFRYKLELQEEFWNLQDFVIEQCMLKNSVKDQPALIAPLRAIAW